jgi:hypothetical protein
MGEIKKSDQPFKSILGMGGEENWAKESRSWDRNRMQR